MFYTYILECADGSFYTGWTNHLKARLETHNKGKGARYTRGRLPVKLVYWETLVRRSDAQQREAAIKKLNKTDKEKLIAGFNIISKEHT